MFKLTFLSIVTLISVVSCGQKQPSSLNIPKGESVTSKREAVATFAAGCFWHTEIVFQSLFGVRDAVSGFAGGSHPKPTYDMVSGGNTGHAEVVNIYYDPEKVTFQTLVSAFFASHDPTTLNRQGNDVGEEYRSIAFYRNEAEKKIIETEISKLISSKKYNKKIVTEVKPFEKFFPAEAYHQEYISNHPENGYVRNVSIPDYLHFRKTFPGRFKD